MAPGSSTQKFKKATQERRRKAGGSSGGDAFFFGYGATFNGRDPPLCRDLTTSLHCLQRRRHLYLGAIHRFVTDIFHSVSEKPIVSEKIYLQTPKASDWNLRGAFDMFYSQPQLQAHTDSRHLEKLYNKYKDPSLDMILADGISLVCTDLKVDPQDIVMRSFRRYIILLLARQNKRVWACNYTRAKVKRCCTRVPQSCEDGDVEATRQENEELRQRLSSIEAAFVTFQVGQSNANAAASGGVVMESSRASLGGEHNDLDELD